MEKSLVYFATILDRSIVFYLGKKDCLAISGMFLTPELLLGLYLNLILNRTVFEVKTNKNGENFNLMFRFLT